MNVNTTASDVHQELREPAGGGIGWVGFFFAAKNAHDPAATHAHFHPDTCTFADATLGMVLSTSSEVRGLWDQMLPTLPPAARSYPTRVIGTSQSAVAFITNTPEMFGSEIRSVAVVDRQDGKVVRWVDYWNGRAMGTSRVAELRGPAEHYPVSLGESDVQRTTTGPIDGIANTLAAALTSGDVDAAASLFAPDALLEDQTLHLAFHGRIAVERFLGRAMEDLPWAIGTRVRHITGAHHAGAYEWAGADRVPGGVIVLELDGESRIAALTSVWDGSRITDDELADMVSLSVP
jgi:ketosteroid isomerase-like protein